LNTAFVDWAISTYYITLKFYTENNLYDFRVSIQVLVNMVPDGDQKNT